MLRIASFSCHATSNPSCDADRTIIPQRAGATSRLSAHSHIVIQLASDSLNRHGEPGNAPTGVLARPWSGSHPWRRRRPELPMQTRCHSGRMGMPKVRRRKDALSAGGISVWAFRALSLVRWVEILGREPDRGSVGGSSRIAAARKSGYARRLLSLWLRQQVKRAKPQKKPPCV